MNKSDVPRYPRDPQQCAFFNNKFLIFSSLGSFFIPCIIIFAIYYRIFLVIMAQARKTRKQLRPKAIIQSAAAQHRNNADTLITSYYNERQSIANIASVGGERTSLTLPIDLNELNPAAVVRSLDTQRNSLMLKLTTPALSAPLCLASSEPIDDGFDPFDRHEQTNGEKPLEMAARNKTKNCSSQTDRIDSAHRSAKRSKGRLKSKASLDGSAVAAAVKSTANNVKTAKRKAYSRMKKERKATQTLIIVLSKSSAKEES